jgi:hypothetical protein
MDDGVGVVGVGKGNRSDCRCGGWTAMEGPSVVVGMMLGVLRVLGRTFRHRHSRAGRNGSLRPNCRSNLGRSWLIFRKRERSNLTGWLKTSCRCQHLVGMAVDADVAPDLRRLAVGPDQHRGAKNPKEALAIHGFFAPGAIGLQHLMLFI